MSDRYVVIVWDNAGSRKEQPAGNDLDAALALAKRERIIDNRTVKIGMMNNAIFHWSRSVHLDRNHWTRRATADEFFV